MSTQLVIGVPSKGRLQEKAADFFARAGLVIEQPGGARNYQGRIKGITGVEIAFLSASEIARELAAGAVHFGVTGLDLIYEKIIDPAHAVEPVIALGFGHADVVVAVPQAWIDVARMADLADVAMAFRARNHRPLRLATKYIHTTRAFFAEHGIADYRIVESLGATEGAPASGAAELIVDITSTGATLAANNLKILQDGVIRRSQAHLVAALDARWDDASCGRARAVLDRIAAQEHASAISEIRTIVSNPVEFGREAAALFGAALPFGATRGAALTLHCPRARVYECVAWLRGHGAETVTVAALDYVFEPANPLFDNLIERLEQRS